jgi:peptidoglycan/LPS O-acetylase OafA/YrhL
MIMIYGMNSKTVIPRSLVRVYRGTNRATYCRAVAAIGVMTIHYGGFGIRDLFSSQSFLNRMLNNLIDFGGQGPTIFFVASGFVLQSVYGNNRAMWEILVSRYFRLAPAYLFVSILTIYFQDLHKDMHLSLAIQKILFLDIFFFDAYAFNPIGIGYFVVIEFWLSFFLIATRQLARSMSRRRHLAQITVLSFASFCLSYFGQSIASVIGLETFQSEILKYQFFFILGAVAFEVKAKYQVHQGLQIFIIPIVFSVLNFDLYLGYLASILTIVILITEGVDGGQHLIKPLIVIGNICYSIYLLHIPILRTLDSNASEASIVLCALFVLFFSLVVYLCVELPFITFGKRIVQQF